jgi:uroporphyrinogen decarboxylase
VETSQNAQSKTVSKSHNPWAAAHESAFMKACRREKTEYTPIWLMRQAGRYQASYRAIREKVGFLELCKNPQLAAQVTVQAVEDLQCDAAIIFADILLLLEPLGAGLEFAKGDGPVIHNPVKEADDVKKLRPYSTASEIGYVMDAVKLTRSQLPEHIPLIGFSGAPFTLASYLLEGGASKNFEKTKVFMYKNQEAFSSLMTLLSDLIIEYLLAQAASGAQAVQLFDSWVGCLSQGDYELFVQPHMVRIVSAVQNGYKASNPDGEHLPVIHFGTSTAHLLPNLAAAKSDVIGLDWRLPLNKGWDIVGADFAVQGNLDPVVLFAPQTEIKKRVQLILDQAKGRNGHIFNLGHGILPGTPVENVKYLIEIVHEYSRV